MKSIFGERNENKNRNETNNESKNDNQINKEFEKNNDEILKDKEFKQNKMSSFILSLIYEKNVIRPTALYLFEDCSVLSMPFAELGKRNIKFN